MKVENIKISNFRGIGHADIDMENFTTLIGPNNIGKSTILHALHLLLDNKKPKQEDWPGKAPSDSEMIIEVQFNDIQEWERKKPAISQLLHGDTLKIKLTAIWKSEAEEIEHKYSVYCAEEVIEGFPRNISDAKKLEWLKAGLEKTGITKADDFNLKKDDLKAYIRSNNPDKVKQETDWHEKKFANSLQQAIPHVMYVPASFKIEDDLKTTASSPFSYLFSNRLFPHVKADGSYTEYMEKASNLQKKLKGIDGHDIIAGLNNELDQVSKSLNQILDFDAKVKLSISEIEVEPLFIKAATFLISDDIETSLAYQGSGVQRALAYAMLESNAEVDSSTSGEQRTVVVLFEEPELYIHPHLMRRLKKTLEKKSESNSWQVICSTHSPFLIDIANKPESLKLIRRDHENKRVVHQVKSDIFVSDGTYDERKLLRAALDFHPSVCESLFAKRVVLVEGDTEVAVFSMAEELIQKFGLPSHLVKDTTIISAGGKWTIPAIARILNSLKISYKVIHDCDRKGLTDDELKEKTAIHPFKANEKILSVAGPANVFVVEDTFEHVIWEQGVDEIKATDKPYNSWLRVKQFLDDTSTLSDKCHDALKKITEFAFC